MTLLISGGVFISLHSLALAFEVGDKGNFFIDPSYDFSNRTQISATLKKISEKTYFYIEDEYWDTLSLNQQNLYLDSLNNVAKNFDTTTYPALS